MANPLSTEEILALCRSQDGGGASPAESAPAPSEPEPAAAEAAPAEEQASEAPAAAPGSTSDILAAARAQGANGGAGSKPAASSKPSAAAAPSGTADILAAARAQAAGKSASAAPKPAAKAKPTAAAAKAKPAGNAPSVQDMLKAVREQSAKPAAAVAAKPDAPAKPSKPPLPSRKPKAAEAVGRRGVIGTIFLTPAGLAWTLLTTATGIFSLAMARFMMPNVLVEPPTRFKIGPSSDYPPETVSTKWKALRGIWVVNTAQYDGNQLVYALASVCTHLGCTPNWLEGEQKFKCPCHGSGFYINGVNFEGPAPRPLERVGIRVAEDGMLEVDKSVKYQQEMGQWDDAASFVALS